MEIETTIHEISGSYFVRIPANLASYFKLKGKDKAKIKDTARNKADITFTKW